MARPLWGMAFGATAIALALISMASRGETPPAAYVIFDYVLLIVGGVAIVGSIVAHRRQK
jgi:hypothetical protein